MQLVSPQIEKFHLSNPRNSTSHADRLRPPKTYLQALSSMPGIHLTGKSFLTGVEARSDDR